MVEREAWIDGTGTPGNPWPVHLPGVQGLLVTHVNYIHREVEELLTTLRRARSKEVFEFQRRRE